MDLTLARVTLGVYAVLLAVGGVMGFVKARSRPSLVSGLACALMTLACLFLLGIQFRLGAGLGAVLAALLLGFFGSRFARSRKVMPAGLMSLVSAVAALLLAVVALRGT